MIALLDDAPPGVLGFRAEGRLDRGELATVVVPPVRAASSAAIRCTCSSRWRRASRRSTRWRRSPSSRRASTASCASGRVRRGAVVTDVGWLTGSVGLMGWMVPGELKTFAPAERAEALAWAAG
jgi:hypothetical protein